MSEKKQDCWHPHAYYSAEHDNFYCGVCKAGMGTAYYLAQTELTALRAENEKLIAIRSELVEALEPLADLAKYWTPFKDSAAVYQSTYYVNNGKEPRKLVTIRVGDLRKAEEAIRRATALVEKEKEG